MKPTYKKSCAANLDFRFHLAPLQGQTRIAKIESAYNSFILGPRVFHCQTYLEKIMGWESSNVFRFDLGSLLQGQMRISKVKSAYN